MKISAYLLIAFLLGAAAFRLSVELDQVSGFKITAWTTDHSADCGIVLTGGPGRVRDGFALLAQKQIKKLIISGVHPGAHLREIFPEWPLYGDLNEDDVILERRSGTTYGNAQQSLVLVEALHCKDAVLVTSGLHMYRARKTFESVFPSDFPMLYRSVQSGSIRLQFARRIMEAIKSIFYDLWVY
ncbi:MAG: YdcF family protein [Bdellovibrionales bacterium]|nr:YdcF family protein [Bdellovibrionales bacterium]